MNPQRTFESQFAWSPNKETAYGTALADGKFAHGTWLLGFDPPDISKGFRSDAAQAWRGTEFTTYRSQNRQMVKYPLNVQLNALFAAHVFAALMGKVASAQILATAAYEHIIKFMDPLVDGHQLPSTGHWFKAADDLGMKTKGAVCTQASISYTRGQPIIQLSSLWEGSGDFVNADLASIPGLDAETVLGPLFEKDCDILFGTPGSEVSIADRVAAFGLTISNGSAGNPWGYFPGTGLYAARAFTGIRTVTPTLTILAKETDDILALFTGDTQQGLIIRFVGDTLDGAQKFKLEFDIPSVHLTAAKVGSMDNYVVWEIAPGAEGVFKDVAGSVLTLTEVAVGEDAVYSFASHTGAAPHPGDDVVITGFVTGGNNVTGTIIDVTGSASGTVTLALTTQANEVHAGTGTIAASEVCVVTVHNKEAAFLTT